VRFSLPGFDYSCRTLPEPPRSSLGASTSFACFTLKFLFVHPTVGRLGRESSETRSRGVSGIAQSTHDAGIGAPYSLLGPVRKVHALHFHASQAHSCIKLQGKGVGYAWFRHDKESDGQQ